MIPLSHFMYSEIEDFNQDWTFPPESFDYVHLRYLVGCVPNWDNLFEQAFKVLKPGGWVESFEASAIIESDDDSVKPDSALAQWGPIFIKASKTIGNTFTVVGDNLQRPGIEKAGFTDVEQWDSKVRHSSEIDQDILTTLALSYH